MEKKLFYMGNKEKVLELFVDVLYDICQCSRRLCSCIIEQAELHWKRENCPINVVERLCDWCTLLPT